MDEEQQTQACDPYFIDTNGDEVHIGECVTWTESNGSANKLKAGRVLDMNFRTDGSGGIKCMVRVSRKSQNMRSELFTRVEDDTVAGLLTRLVAACGGCMNVTAIDETARLIEAMFEPTDGSANG